MDKSPEQSFEDNNTKIEAEAGIDENESQPLEDDLEGIKAKLAESEEKVLRARADFLNYQRRAIEREVLLKEQAVGNVIREVITALDQFEIALDQKSDVDPMKVVDGIRMAYKEFQGALEKSGVESIRPNTGDKFDPHCHEAISRQPHDDLDVGLILETYSPGYKTGSLLVRPAKVCVVGENI